MGELIIKNGMVYTYIYEGYHAIKLRMADVYVKDGSIEEVAPVIEKNCDTLDATGCLVLPGMVNIGSSTFAERIMQGLICDWQRGKTRIAPMLDMAAVMMTEDEIKAVAMTGLWETANSGAVTVVELERSPGEQDHDHPLRYRAAPKAIIEGVLKAGKEMGIQVLSAYGDEAGSLTIDGMDGANIKGSIVTDSAISCADFGIPYAGYHKIKKGAMMTMGTGATSSSMIKEMGDTARIVRLRDENPRAYKASDVFYSATVVGGRELNEKKHGRLGPGFDANISVVDMKRFSPLSYPISQYLYGATTEDVKHLVCRGNVLKRDGKRVEPLEELLTDAARTAEEAITKLLVEARKTII